jgi:sugar phosphate permease
MGAAAPDAQVGGIAHSPWRILAGGTFALWTYALLYPGVAVLAPAIRSVFDVGLGAAGIALGAVSAGAALSLFFWGALADRIGERAVMSAGLVAAAAALGAAAMASTFAAFVLLLMAAGSLGASANAPSARSVMAWFGPERRGMALGIRQTAVPLGGLAAAAFVPLFSLEGAVLVMSLAASSGARRRR